MIPRELEDVLSQDTETVSGAICFKGMRVPVSALLDYVNGGDSLDGFLLGYSAVSRHQAMMVLTWQDNKPRAMGNSLPNKLIALLDCVQPSEVCTAEAHVDFRLMSLDRRSCMP
jgi:uncharacterized protein (DUF433 family)